MAPQVGLAGLAPQDNFAEILALLGLVAGSAEIEEDATYWSAKRELSGSQIRAIATESIAALERWWPNHFRAELRVGAAVELDLLKETSFENLGNERRYQLLLHLDKVSLANSVVPGTNLRLFLIEQQFTRTCKGVYGNLEREFFGEVRDGRPVHIVCPGQGVDLVGPLLRATSFDRLGAITAEPDAGPRGRNALEVRKAEINKDVRFVRVTPQDLRIDGDGWSSEAGAALARLTLHNIGVFLADRVHLGDAAGSVVLEFGRSAGALEVVLDSAIAPSDPGLAASAATNIVEWTYQPEPEGAQRNWTRERLGFVRSVLHETISLVDESARTATFGSSLAAAADDVEWHWRTFIGGQIEQHSAALRDFTRAVTEQSIDTAARTAAITAGVIDAMKAAVATLLGSFLGAALAPSFNEEIFRLGLISYSVYLFLFVGAIGLGSSVLQYRTANAAYLNRRNHAVELLGDERVANLEADVLKSNRRWYLRTVVGAVLIYLAVLGAAGWATWKVPSLVNDDDPTVIDRIVIDLPIEGPEVSWQTGGLSTTGELTIALSTDHELTVTATGVRTNLCRLLAAQMGDGLLLRNPADDQRQYLVVVESADALGAELAVFDIQGSTGLEPTVRMNGCAQLGQLGLDWERPDWAVN